MFSYCRVCGTVYYGRKGGRCYACHAEDDFVELPDPQRSRTTRGLVTDIREACDAESHAFLGKKAGHKYCFKCGERLHS